MIHVTATLLPGCFARLTLDTPEAVASYIWDHRDQADSWEILPDEHEPAIMREIARLRGDA